MENRRRELGCDLCLCSSTHHLGVVGIEGLFIQGEFLRAQRVVQLDHLRELRAGIKKTVRNQQSRTQERRSWRKKRNLAK